MWSSSLSRNWPWCVSPSNPPSRDISTCQTLTACGLLSCLQQHMRTSYAILASIQESFKFCVCGFSCRTRLVVFVLAVHCSNRYFSARLFSQCSMVFQEDRPRVLSFLWRHPDLFQSGKDFSDSFIGWRAWPRRVCCGPFYGRGMHGMSDNTLVTLTGHIPSSECVIFWAIHDRWTPVQMYFTSRRPGCSAHALRLM
jgi:hypothetical protein